MKMAEVISAAALAYGAYRKLVQVANANGMSAKDFQAAVLAECARVSAWAEQTDRAEDAVFADEKND